MLCSLFICITFFIHYAKGFPPWQGALELLLLLPAALVLRVNPECLFFNKSLWFASVAFAGYRPKPYLLFAFALSLHLLPSDWLRIDALRPHGSRAMSARKARLLLTYSTVPVPFMNNSLLCAGILLGLLAAGCKKDPTGLDRLPEATQQGKGTAGWLLDGKAQVPQPSSISTGDPVDGYWEKTRGGRSLSLSFRQFSVDEDWGVSFFLPDIRRAGTFGLDQVPAITSGLNNAGYGQCTTLRPGPRLRYYTGPDALGELVITRFDTVQNIVSGTFELTPRQDGTTTTVSVTHGRFDLRFDR